MADINVKANVARTSTLGKVRILVEQVVGSPSQAQISQAVADYIDSHPGALSPLSQATKSALLQIAEKVAYIDANGQSYYNALDAALNAKALLSITAVYTQSGTVYDTDSLDSLKSDLVVTAYYDDGTSAVVTGYTLSGELTEGTSTVTVTFMEKTATFTVTVSSIVPSGYTQLQALTSDGNQYIDTGIQFTGEMKYEIEVSNIHNSFTYNAWAFGVIGTGATYLAGVQMYGTKTGSATDRGYAIFRGYPSSQAGGTAGVRFKPDSTATKYLLSQKGNLAWVDGVQVTNTFTAATFTIEETFALFTRNAQGTFTGGGMACTIYRAKFFDGNDNLIHDFVPCLDSNSAPCMYDTVGQQTFYNLGTGTFGTVE